MNQILSFLDDLEALGAEIASKLAPWLAPLLSAVVVAEAVTLPPFEWSVWQAVLTGGAIELSGIATLNTFLLLLAHRADLPDKRKGSMIPLALAGLCAIGYLVTALSLTVVLKLHPELVSLAYGLFVSLALVSAVNLALRRDHNRRTRGEQVIPVKVSKRGQKAANEPGQKIDDTERRRRLDQANENRADQKAERVNQALDLLRQGMSRPAVASELGVSVSTVKRYAKELNGRAHVGQDGDQ